MKIKALLLAGFLLAGLLASLALGKPPKTNKETQTPTATRSRADSLGATTPPTSHNPKCAQVELRGNAKIGSVAFTVRKANLRSRHLVGTQVALLIPTGAKVIAKACSAGGSLTLRDLHVQVAPAKP